MILFAFQTFELSIEVLAVGVSEDTHSPETQVNIICFAFTASIVGSNLAILICTNSINFICSISTLLAF